MKKSLVVFALLALGCASQLLAQGRTDYFNVESPQVHPIDVARVNGHDYILVCNTPDNSVEIWDTDETVPVSNRFLARVPVGLEPVSVRWVPELERFYVANFLGDSISWVSLSASGGPATLGFIVAATVAVSDEPLDMIFHLMDNGDGSSTPTLFVTHMTLDGFGAYHTATLAPLAPGSELMDAVVGPKPDMDFDGNPDEIALKQPWTLDIACGKLFMLGHKGGNTVRYDFDLFDEDLATGARGDLGGLGSTNWDMAFANNDDLYVVGAEAVNDLRDEVNVAAAKTGFVKSMFYVVENVCSGAPKIHRRDVNLTRATFQQGPSLPQQPLPLVDSNGEQGLIAQILTKPVKKGQAMAQLTSVVPYEVTGQRTKVFFTAFSSDKVGRITPNLAQDPNLWPIKRIKISPIAWPAGSMAAPRGLALKRALAAEGDPGDRLYVLNRVDNSVSILDPATETLVGGFALDNDPTPDYVHDGREFLYSAKLSGNGFVSCSSCHDDGRTDGLAWDLGGGPDLPIPPELVASTAVLSWPGDKEFMVTQSLQGLLNWEVPQKFQELFTNAPYHWRGDRTDFKAFNGAFDTLLGGDELSDAEMLAYEEFINSIHYAPNPKQDITRVYSGTLGDPDANDPTVNIDGTGALKGLKIFHTVNSDGLGCAHCHAFPEGSDNLITEVIPGVNPHPVVDPPFVNAPAQPIETAAMRGLFQKEARLDRDGSDFHDDSPITGYEGMMHTGLTVPRPISNDFNGTATINAFNLRFFNSTICPSPQPVFCDNLQAVNQLSHEFDFGSGPIIGKSYTTTQANALSAATAAAFDDAEGQAAVANAGVAVIGNIGGTLRGFWYDLASGAVYREEPSGASFTRSALLALLGSTRDRLVVISTPLGTERRLADPSGQPGTLSGDAPTAVDLVSMVPNTAHVEIPALSAFWDTGNPGFGGSRVHTVRVYQNALLIDGPPGSYGLCSVRHEAPRRFRVAAKGLRHGAELHLFVHDDDVAGPPITSLGPEDAGQVPTTKITLPIYPTTETLADGRQIWQTAVEMEPLLYYRLMTGRPPVAGIIDGLTDLDFNFQIIPEAQPPGTWSPAAWNNHWVRVVNTDGTQADGGWQELTILPGPDCP